MTAALSLAEQLADDIERYPLGNCGPSDDPDMAYAYVAAFRDIAKWELDVLVVVGGADLTEQVEMPLSLWNYLRGVRVITVGFEPDTEDREAPVLGRLSRREGGWHDTILVR